jgi:hypothetical protein
MVARTPNKEIPGDFITLVTRNESTVKEPPPTQARWNTSREKQEAANKMIHNAGDQETPINSGLPDFLAKLNPSVTTVVIVELAHLNKGLRRACGQV